MEKPNLDNVRELFDTPDWKITVSYLPNHIHLNARHTSPLLAEDFTIRFAYRECDYHMRDEMNDEETREIALAKIMEYTALWGERVKYEGTPMGVSLYEGKFGESSIADTPRAKAVRDVETAFKKAGYTVMVNAYDKDTDIESWLVMCTRTEGGVSLFTAYLAENEDEAEERAVDYSTDDDVRRDGCWVYLGSADAIELFESAAETGEVIFYKKKEEIKIACADTEAVEKAFTELGWNIQKTPDPKGEGMTLSIAKDGKFVVAGTGINEWVEFNGTIGYRASAEDMDVELITQNNWFYYGDYEGLDILEECLEGQKC